MLNSILHELSQRDWRQCPSFPRHFLHHCASVGVVPSCLGKVFISEKKVPLTLNVAPSLNRLQTAYETEMEWPGLHLTGRCDLRWQWPHLCTWKSGPGRWACQVVELNHRGRAIPALHSAQSLYLQRACLKQSDGTSSKPPRLGVARGVAKDAGAGSGQGRGGTSAGRQGRGRGRSEAEQEGAAALPGFRVTALKAPARLSRLRRCSRSSGLGSMAPLRAASVTRRGE